MSTAHTKKIHIIIPARYESSRLPHKLLLKLTDEKSILQHTYEACKQCERVNSITIATDAHEIVDACNSFGADSVLTSKSHPNGTSRCSEAARLLHLDDSCDIVVNVQGDMPYIKPKHIQKVIDAARQWNDDQYEKPVMAIGLHTRIQDEQQWRDGSLIKLTRKRNGDVLTFSRAPIPSSKDGLFKPSKHDYYAHVEVHAFKPSFLKIYEETEITPLQLHEDVEYLKILELGFHVRTLEVEDVERGVNTQEDYDYILRKYRT